MIEAEFPFDLPDFDDAGYRNMQVQLQEDYVKTEEERKIRHELMLKVYRIPPPNEKVKLFLHNGLGVHEGIFQVPEQPEWPYDRNNPLLLQLEYFSLKLSNNPTSPFQFMHTDIHKWEFV